MRELYTVPDTAVSEEFPRRNKARRSIPAYQTISEDKENTINNIHTIEEEESYKAEDHQHSIADIVDVNVS